MGQSRWMGIAVAASLLTSCGIGNLGRSDAERVAEVLPLAEAVGKARATLDSMIAGDNAERERLDREFASRLELRAAKCLKRELSFDDDREDVRRKLDTGCVETADREMLAWLQAVRLRFLVSAPPLRARPASSPDFIATTETAREFRMAADAAVLIAARDRKLEVIDAGTGATIYRTEDFPYSPNLQEPSPNGRVFTVENSSRIDFYDSETGELLAGHPGHRALQWVDATTAILLHQDVNGRSLLDARTGTLSPIKGLSTMSGNLARLTTYAPRFAVTSFSRVMTFEVTPGDAGPSTRILAQGELPGGRSGSNGHIVVTLDGRHIAHASPRGILLTDPDSLQSRFIDTWRFNPTALCAHDEPGELLVLGSLRDEFRHEMYYVYDIDGDAFMAVTDERLMLPRGGVAKCPARFESLGAAYVQAGGVLKRVGQVKRDPRILRGALAAHFDARYELEAEQRRAALNAASPGSPPAIPARALLDDMKGVEVVAVGVYEAAGANRGAGAQSVRFPGPVAVMVRPTDEPIVLVLASYEAVTWHLNLNPRAKVKAILVGGQGPKSTVIGAGDVRVHSINGFAYDRDSQNFRALDDEVLRWTGRRIGNFQGSYGGRTFLVGGL